MFSERIKQHPTPKIMPLPSSETELFAFLGSDEAIENNEPASIYFHIPFCDNICSFCAMNRSKLDDELDEYLLYLLDEIKRFSSTKYIKNKKINSIYFGGGTPTVFKSQHLATLMRAINENFDITKDAEYSFESTLHNLSEEKLETMVQNGCNRYSIGIQSFNSNARKFLNRVGDFDFVAKKLEKIRANFSGTLCCDIIYNYPGERDEDVLNDARFIKQFGIDSVSFYSLIFFPNSKLAKSIDSSYYELARDKKLHDLFLEQMLKNGFKIMEHTKLVIDDDYRYIRNTHAGLDIIPIGVGAGGNIANFSLFSPRKGVKMVAKKSKRAKEFGVFYNLFQYEFIDLKRAFSFLAPTVQKTLQDFLNQCKKHGYIDINDDFMHFKKDGIFYANSIANEIINITKNDFLEAK